MDVYREDMERRGGRFVLDRQLECCGWLPGHAAAIHAGGHRVVNAGTASVNGEALQGLTIDLGATAPFRETGAVLALRNTVLDSATSIDVNGVGDGLGSFTSAEIDTSGIVASGGTISVVGDPSGLATWATVRVGAGGLFANFGTIQTSGGLVAIDGNSPSAVVVNNGEIDVQSGVGFSAPIWSELARST